MSCTWCHKLDQHGPENSEYCDEYCDDNYDDDFCNHCEFCESNICCDCWDRDDVCYFPGAGYCPMCKDILFKCPDCVIYLKGLMSGLDMPMCEIHLNSESPSYVGVSEKR
jgi:hypothetical protein